MSERDFDLLLYGASGFTGRQTAHYIAGRTKPGEVRWGIAGRNREKLEAVRASLGPDFANLEILVADCYDKESIDAMAARTRVMLTTAGPYALYGNTIVDACVRYRTDYVDITGETVWVRDLIDRHHTQAAADGTRIIPFSGFDSVPSDLGAWLIVSHLRRNHGLACRSVRAFHSMRGGLNGGTMATAFNLYESGESDRARDPFLLDPPREHPPSVVAASRDPLWPSYNEALDIWGAPFVMGPINTRVVRRSAALSHTYGEGYGEQFTYQEYSKFRGIGGAIEAGILSAGSALFSGIMQSPLRAAIKPLVPKPGEGPSERTMNEGWFNCELIGIAEDGRRVRATITDKGDPGNRATVKLLCESALCLVLDRERLPGGSSRGGILTPATGLGDQLADRLRRAAMTIRIED